MLDTLQNNTILIDYLIFKIEDIRILLAFIGMIGGGLAVISFASLEDCFGHLKDNVSKTRIHLNIIAIIIGLIFVISALILPSSKELSYLLTGNQTYYQSIKIQE